MHRLTMDFLREQYKRIKLLKKSNKGEVWLVSQPDGTPAILRIINHIGIPGAILRDNPSGLWPRILDFLEDKDNNQTIIVEEYISGDSLQEDINAGRHFREEEAGQLMLELCAGLSKLHALGIVHRDIKPANIIRQTGGGFKLIDFDSARQKGGHANEQDTMLLGTRGYAPPEQYGYSQTDRRSDIYSLGVTVDELLGENYRGYLRPVIRKCRALDPAMRYQRAEEVMGSIRRRRILRIAFPLLTALLLVLVMAGTGYLRGRELPARETIEKSIYQLEEIIESKEIPYIHEPAKAPEEPVTPQLPTDVPINEPNKADTRGDITHKEFRGDGVLIGMEGHGNGLEGGAAGRFYVSSDVYRYWPRENQDKATGEYTVYLPEDWYIDVTIDNADWNGTWQHPVFDVTYIRKDWAGNPVESHEVQELPAIPSGKRGILRLNIGGMKIDNVSNYYGPEVRLKPRWPAGTQLGSISDAPKTIELLILNDHGYRVWEDIK